MKHILFIESGSGYGGSARCLKLLLEHIDKKTIKPSVLYYHLGPSIEDIKTSGLRVKKYSIFSIIHSILVSDVVYLNNEIYSHFLNILLANLFHKKCICHMRGIRALTRAEKFLTKWIDKFISVSQVCKSNLIKEDISEEKIEVVHDGVDIQNLLPRKKRNGHLNIGVVSRIVPKKGHLIFIEVAKKLAMEKATNKLDFLIFGDDTTKDKKTRRQLENIVQTNNLQTFIHFPGWQSDAKSIYGSIDIAVCPSELEESFGMNIVEAMSFGKPIIASRVGAYKELIQDGVNGLLFQPGDVIDLAQKIELLLGDQALRERLAREAYRTAKEKFDIKTNVEKIEKVIRECMNM